MIYNNQYAICDIESGGLPQRLKKRATIEVALTEIAIVIVSNPGLEIVDKKSWLIKPYSKELIYEDEAAKVSGITKQMCEKDGQDIEVVFKELCDFVKKYKKGQRLPILTGHNLRRFDLEFIENLFEMMKTDPSKYFDESVEDTMEWMRKKYVEAASFNLFSCTTMAGIDHVEAHRALPDTVATAKLWVYLLKCLRGSAVEQKEVKKFRDSFTFEF
jgi:DNA polymerase III epsilon subunit-like protein